MEQSKVALVMALLAGKSSLWGTTVWENKHPCVLSFQALSEEMKQVSDWAVAAHQWHRSVADYSIEFRTLDVECKWNQEAQWDMFFAWAG